MKPSKDDEILNDPAWKAWVDCDECELGGDVNQADAGLHALAHARAVLAPERARARREKHAADGLLERLDKRIKGCCGYGGKSCAACRPDISATSTYEAILLGSQFEAEALDKEPDDE